MWLGHDRAARGLIVTIGSAREPEPPVSTDVRVIPLRIQAARASRSLNGVPLLRVDDSLVAA